MAKFHTSLIFNEVFLLSIFMAVISFQVAKSYPGSQFLQTTAAEKKQILDDIIENLERLVSNLRKYSSALKTDDIHKQLTEPDKEEEELKHVQRNEDGPIPEFHHDFEKKDLDSSTDQDGEVKNTKSDSSSSSSSSKPNSSDLKDESLRKTLHYLIKLAKEKEEQEEAQSGNSRTSDTIR